MVTPSLPTIITVVAISRNIPCSTTPAISLKILLLATSISPISFLKYKSIMQFPLCFSQQVLSLATHPQSLNKSGNLFAVNFQQTGTTSTGTARPLPAQKSHQFRLINNNNELFTRALYPFFLSTKTPQPFTKFIDESTSSAPSMARSITGCESRSDKGIPNKTAWSCVIFEVGIPTMFFSFPWCNNSPILSTACVAVESVPSPTTIPDLTNSTDLFAAIFQSSSWVKPTEVGDKEDKIFSIEDGLNCGKPTAILLQRE